MAFEPINTQEELDAIITSRLERERASIAKQYADYEDIRMANEALKQQISDGKSAAAEADKLIADLRGQVKNYELDKLRLAIAQETGIPLSLRDRLQGTSEEELRKDAEKLVEIIGKPAEKTAKRAPEPNPEPSQATGTDAALMGMVKGLNFNR